MNKFLLPKSCSKLHSKLCYFHLRWNRSDDSTYATWLMVLFALQEWNTPTFTTLITCLCGMSLLATIVGTRKQGIDVMSEPVIRIRTGSLHSSALPKMERSWLPFSFIRVSVDLFQYNDENIASHNKIVCSHTMHQELLLSLAKSVVTKHWSRMRSRTGCLTRKAILIQPGINIISPALRLQTPTKNIPIWFWKRWSCRNWGWMWQQRCHQKRLA